MNCNHAKCVQSLSCQLHARRIVNLVDYSPGQVDLFTPLSFYKQFSYRRSLINQEVFKHEKCNAT